MRRKAISAKVALLPGGYLVHLSEFSMAYHNREPLPCKIHHPIKDTLGHFGARVVGP